MPLYFFRDKVVNANKRLDWSLTSTSLSCHAFLLFQDKAVLRQIRQVLRKLKKKFKKNNLFRVRPFQKGKILVLQKGKY